MIEPVSHVADMAAYALADLAAPDDKKLISLSQNESVRPPSPSVIEAAQTAAQTGNAYPDPDWTDLRKALSAQHGITSEHILCGSGSLDLIGCIARTYLEPGSAALAPEHAYPFFRSATRMTGARFDIAREDDLHADLNALLDAVRPETRIVFLANPGNPTGTRLPRADILGFRDALRGDILLVLDEAYGEFADHTKEPMFDLVDRGDTIVLRTFSKAYGLAGSRVGWGLFPEPIALQVRKLLNPNNVSSTSQAMALASVKDQRWMRETCELTAKIRDGFAEKLGDLGFELPRSFTNFVLIPFSSPEAAQDADAFLKSEGVFLRAQAGAGLPHCLRATIGAQEDVDLAFHLIETWATRNGI